MKKCSCIIRDKRKKEILNHAQTFPNYFNYTGSQALKKSDYKFCMSRHLQMRLSVCFKWPK